MNNCDCCNCCKKSTCKNFEPKEKKDLWYIASFETIKNKHPPYSKIDSSIVPISDPMDKDNGLTLLRQLLSRNIKNIHLIRYKEPWYK